MLSPPDPPRITSPPEDVVVGPGSPTSLPCGGSGTPTPTLLWKLPLTTTPLGIGKSRDWLEPVMTYSDQ